MGTCIVGIALLFMVALAIRSMVKAKKAGKSPLGCGGNCDHCNRGCH